jgi:hypothetical protein
MSQHIIAKTETYYQRERKVGELIAARLITSGTRYFCRITIKSYMEDKRDGDNRNYWSNGD